MALTTPSLRAPAAFAAFATLTTASWSTAESLLAARNFDGGAERDVALVDRRELRNRPEVDGLELQLGMRFGRRAPAEDGHSRDGVIGEQPAQ